MHYLCVVYYLWYHWLLTYIWVTSADLRQQHLTSFCAVCGVLFDCKRESTVVFLGLRAVMPLTNICSQSAECLFATFVTKPPWGRLLALGVFKPSCSTPFTLFLHLVSIYWPFQLYFIPKTCQNTSVFSSLLIAYFYLFPVFIYNTALLYIILLTLCSHLQTQCVCRALHPVLGEDGILVAEVPRGVQRASSARTSLDGWLGWPDPINRLVVFCPNFD